MCADAAMEAEHIVIGAEIIHMSHSFPLSATLVIVASPLVVVGVEIDAGYENTAVLGEKCRRVDTDG